jgi:hypothetical protein
MITLLTEPEQSPGACKHRYSIDTRNYLPVLVCLHCGATWKSCAPTREGVPVSADLPNLRGN